MSDEPKLRMILFKRRGKFKLAACRGGKKGCNVNLEERSKIGPCEFCYVLEDENMTLGEVAEHLAKGEA